MIQANYWSRIWTYLGERFPPGQHGFLIAAFSFSAISLSREIRGVAGFIGPQAYAGAYFFSLLFFLHLRLADEHKDADEDALVRPHLPVPRGLVSLQELRYLGYITLLLQFVLLCLFPVVIPLAVAAYAWQYLMLKEFFMPEFIKKHAWLYVGSHMLILPLVDLVSSGFDWAVAGHAFPLGFIWIFGLSYSNGLVLEVGRKIRHESQEEPGYATYSATMGGAKATLFWLLLMAVNIGLAAFIGHFLYSATVAAIVAVIGCACCIPAVLFYNEATPARSKLIEKCAGIWALGMYLGLGTAHYF